ncbi:MAG: SpoIIE family protein phosphatase [Clostridiales bacterium]|nr:SpoIIE family protein phosphatase [Clostridiales bacterium]
MKESILERDKPVIRSLITPVKVRQLYRHAGAFALCLLLSCTGVADGLSPFGTAAVACMPAAFLPAAVIGAGIGSVITQTSVSALRYVAALLSAAVINSTLNKFEEIRKSRLFEPLVTFSTLFVTALALAFADKATLNVQLIKYLCEALAGGASAFFISECFGIKTLRGGLKAVTPRELISIVIVAGLILMALARVNIYGFVPARVASVFLILVAARYAHESGGSIVGVCTGISMSLATGTGFLTGGYAFAGLLAGAFSPMGRLGASAAFVIACATAAIMQQDMRTAVFVLCEAVVASAVFTFLPDRLVGRLESCCTPTSVSPLIDSVRGSIVMRLRSAAKTVSEVSASLGTVNETLRRSELPDVSGIYDKVRENICSSCGLCKTCWEQSCNETLNVFNDMFSLLGRGESISEKKLPQFFAARCIRFPLLAECFSLNYKAYLIRLSAQSRIDEIRAVSAGQFEGISDLLYDLSDEFDEKASFDMLAAQRVRTVLDDMQIKTVDVCCTIDKYDRMKLEIHCENPRLPVNRTQLLEKLEKACERAFEIPDILAFDGLVHITAVQRAPLRAVIGAAQFCAEGERFCGDAYECFSDSHGRYYVIISDGMGTGARAAVGAAMASGIAARLIEAGFRADGALKMVNSALITKSRDESSATLDIACIDLFGGHVEFYKAGAPSTLVKRRGRLAEVECASLPAGILRETEFSHASGSIGAGDMILLSSDGVTDEDKQEIRRRMKHFKGGEINVFARETASWVKQKHSAEPHSDDVTVVVAGIAPND